MHPSIPNTRGDQNHLPAPARMMMPRSPGSDFIYVSTDENIGRNAGKIRERCMNSSLTCQIRGPVDMPDGLKKGIRSLHAERHIHPHSLVKLELHGSVQSNQHTIDFESDPNKISTLETIRDIREGGLEFGRPYFGGLIVLHICDSDRLTEALSKVPGVHIHCGEGQILLGLSPKIDRILFTALGWQKEHGWQAPESLWGPLYFNTPCTLHLTGANVLQLVRHVRLPQDLTLARDDEQIEDAFLQRLVAGEPKEVEQFLKAWPRLATIKDHFDAPLFRFANCVERTDMMSLLLGNDHIRWEDELDILLSFSKRNLPDARRAFNRILDVLEQNIKRELSLHPSDRKKAVLGVAKALIINALDQPAPEEKRDLVSVLTEPAAAFDPFDSSLPAPPSFRKICAAVNWHFIDQVSRRAADLLNLSLMDSIEFNLRLRVRLGADLN
jgi:hypothetical protein